MNEKGEVNWSRQSSLLPRCGCKVTGHFSLLPPWTIYSFRLGATVKVAPLRASSFWYLMTAQEEKSLIITRRNAETQRAQP